MLRRFLIGSEERSMEDRMDFPLEGNAEAECRL